MSWPALAPATLINAPVGAIEAPSQASAHVHAMTRQLRLQYQQVGRRLSARGQREAANAALSIADEIAAAEVEAATGGSSNPPHSSSFQLPQEIIRPLDDLTVSALVSAYRLYATGVDNTLRSFEYFTHLAAHARTLETQLVLEEAAARQLRLSASLRKRRRASYRAPERDYCSRPSVGSIGDLEAFLARREDEITTAMAAVSARLAQLGETSIASILVEELLADPSLASGPPASPLPQSSDCLELLVAAQRPLERLGEELEYLLANAEDDWRATVEFALDHVIRRLAAIVTLIRQVENNGEALA